MTGLELFGKTVFDTLFMDYRIMAPVAAISILMFFFGVYSHLNKWGQVIPEGSSKPLGAWGAFRFILSKIFEDGILNGVWLFIRDVLLQSRELRIGRPLEWIMHLLIFWGWIGLAFLTVVAAAAEFYGPFILNADYSFFNSFWKYLEMPNNILGYMLALGIVIALARRTLFPDVPKARFESVDWIAILGLSVVVVTGFYIQWLRIDLGVLERAVATSYPLSYYDTVGNPLVVFHEVFSMLFMVGYIPYSKFWHIIATPLTLLVNKGGE